MKRKQAHESPVAGGSAPTEIRPGCWMVGHRNPHSLLQCNTYLRELTDGNAKRRICIDPGSQFDFPVVESNIKQVIGDLRELDSFTLNHQDPDVVGNAFYLCEANPKISAVMTEAVWRLAQHLLFRPGEVRFANQARSRFPIAGAQNTWQLVPTPFCHFRGAMAFYDPEIRTLFTGDLFGGFNQLNRVHLSADDDDWQGIAQFHQIYMPTREVLRYAVRQIRALDPPVEVIAPQHGFVIVGDRVQEFLDRMHELLVGNDLLAVELDDTYLNEYQEVARQIVDWAKEAMGPSEAIDRMTAEGPDDPMAQRVHIEGEDIRITSQGYTAIVDIFSRLSSGELPQFVNILRGEILNLCQEKGIPIPPVGAGVEEVGEPGGY